MPAVMRTFYKVFGRFICMPIEGCGERHLFLCASAKYPAAAGVRAARGTGGMYSDGESTLSTIDQILAGQRAKRVPAQI